MATGARSGKFINEISPGDDEVATGARSYTKMNISVLHYLQEMMKYYNNRSWIIQFVNISVLKYLLWRW